MYRGDARFLFYSYYSSLFFFVKGKKQSFLFLFLLLLFFSSCSTTKFVPEGKALLDKVDIKVKSPYLKKEELSKYLRQTPNSSVFGVWRMQLQTYSSAGKDSTKWINRVLMNAGEAPVIYNPSQRYLSEQNLEKVIRNRGFMDASVSSDVIIKKKKATLIFHVEQGEPYRLRKYDYEFENKDILNAVADSTASLIESNMLFSIDVLDKERERIASSLRRKGYYNFNKNLLVYRVDSALNQHQVDVKMMMREFEEEERDSVYNMAFKKYYIRKVLFSADKNLKHQTNTDENLENTELIRAGNFILKKTDRNFLRLKTLVGNTFVLPNTTYSDLDVEKTYAALNNLSAVKYVNLTLREMQTKDSLDCAIVLAPTEAISLTTELEATYTEGFWGGAANLGTVHRNLFRGAESLTLQGRLAYEWQKGVLAQELGAQASLLFPNFLFPFVAADFKSRIRANTDFTLNANYQYRPQEFTVTNVGGGVKYGWRLKRFRHTFEVIDFNYVNFDVTEVFKQTFLETNKFNRHNYEDLLISRIGYIGSFSTLNLQRPLRNHFSMRYSLETSGNLFSLINVAFGAKPKKNGLYTVMGVPYSQYVRGNYDITYHQVFDEDNRFVYHLGMGVGVPFGNSTVIPYQRRFFSGGAYSVRGWSETTLGPGIYQKNKNIQGRDYNQMGDIRLDMNMEYRFKMFKYFNGALFFDAGNVWTIKPYETQKGGEFKLKEFYKQIALAYGVGLRLDFSFVLIRLDWGIKLYDPARENPWVKSPGRFDHAIHFGIGYPF